MSALTEVEILACLRENLRLAAEDCEKLSISPFRGFVYDRFRKELRLIEGCCRQMAYWRDGDARWLPIGFMMSEAHKRAGGWLRMGRHTQKATQEARVASHPVFMKLAEQLRHILVLVANLETQATGVIGSILPTPLPGPHREHRPVSVIGEKLSKGGIIIPTGVAA